jgi:hypothetical protein
MHRGEDSLGAVTCEGDPVFACLGVVEEAAVRAEPVGQVQDSVEGMAECRNIRKWRGAVFERPGKPSLNRLGEHLEAFENRRSFASEAAIHIRAWGCELYDGEAKVKSEGAGRPVDLFTVAVGLLWEREQVDYDDYAPETLCRSLLDVLHVFWPEKTWEEVQAAANRFRQNRTTYDRAFGRLTPPGSDMDWS